MTRVLYVSNLKCKHCGSEDVIFEDREYQEVEFGRVAPQVWSWHCLDCDKTSVTLDYGTC